MQQQPQTLWKDLKNFFLCKYLRCTGKLSYPHSILPKPKYKSIINIDDLQSHQELVVLRRSSKSKEESFNSIGNLRSDIIDEKEIAGLSMNLMGTFLKEEHIVFSPKMRTKAVERWPGLVKVYLSEFKSLYNILSTVSPIYYRVSDLHNITIPYKKQYDTEIEKVLKKLKLKFDTDNLEFKANGQIQIEHAPTYLNYWHVELCLLDFNTNPVRKIKNQFHTSLASYVLSDILSVNGHSSLKEPVKPIHSCFYKLNNRA